jgi:hypothetical protein
MAGHEPILNGKNCIRQEETKPTPSSDCNARA